MFIFLTSLFSGSAPHGLVNRAGRFCVRPLNLWGKTKVGGIELTIDS